MLEFERRSKVIHRRDHHHHPVCVDIKMPVDFASYLLSASPPGFDLHYQLRSSFGLEQERNGANNKRHNNSLLHLKSIMVSAESELEKDEVVFQDVFDQEIQNTANNSLSTAYYMNDDSDFKPNAETCNCVETSKPKSLKKKVSFADESGLAIASVRIITESPDTPPQLRPEVLASLTKGALAGVTEIPPLVLNFEQPAANYVAFRDKITRNYVSLENVILKDYNVLGTIKVKNIAFDKTVNLRCTFDSWETSVDVPANYVPTSGVGIANEFDTFSFEISVPPTFNVHKKIQFCISYDIGSEVFWDNNNGNNYELVSAEWKEVTEKEKERKSMTKSIESKTTEPAVFDNNHFHDSWTEYSSWTDSDNSVPYY